MRMQNQYSSSLKNQQTTLRKYTRSQICKYMQIYTLANMQIYTLANMQIYANIHARINTFYTLFGLNTGKHLVWKWWNCLWPSNSLAGDTELNIFLNTTQPSNDKIMCRLLSRLVITAAMQSEGSLSSLNKETKNQLLLYRKKISTIS